MKLIPSTDICPILKKPYNATKGMREYPHVVVLRLSAEEHEQMYRGATVRGDGYAMKLSASVLPITFPTDHKFRPCVYTFGMTDADLATLEKGGEVPLFSGCYILLLLDKEA